MERGKQELIEELEKLIFYLKINDVNCDNNKIKS